MKASPPAQTWMSSVLLLSALGGLCNAITFQLMPHSTRCLSHEMFKNQLAVGEYDVVAQPDQVVSLKITDTEDHTALNRESIGAEGKFAITSDFNDYYKLCFTHERTETSAQQSEPIEITFDYLVGFDARKQEAEPMSKDKLTDLERDLNRLERISNAIIDDFAHLKKRGEEMRDTNESTNKRLFYQSVVSLVVVAGLATWQVLYLRSYFKARKLID